MHLDTSTLLVDCLAFLLLFKCDGLDIDFANIAGYMQKYETTLELWSDGDFHILPLIAE